MGQLLYQWLDLIWLPAGWFVVHRDHRWMTIAFILTCILSLRTQVELMGAIGFPNGILPVLDSPLYTRGLITYGLIIALFLLLAHFSQATEKIIFFTATITIYIVAFCMAMIVMLL